MPDMNEPGKKKPGRKPWTEEQKAAKREWWAEQKAKKAEKEEDNEDSDVTTAMERTYAKDFDDKNIWNSVSEASKNSQPISDDLTPAEQEFLDSFKKR